MIFLIRMLPYWLLLSQIGTTQDAAPPPKQGSPAARFSSAYFNQQVKPVLTQHCGSCHEDDAEHDERFLTANDVEDIQQARSLWASVATQLRNRTMPPADEPQPSESQRIAIANWIDDHLRTTACSGEEYAGWVVTRRLNRREYENTIRDLFGVQLGFARTLPPDSGGGEGFDNNGETLFLPPLLLERYLEAAQLIVDSSIIVPPVSFYFAPKDLLPFDESLLKKGKRDAFAQEDFRIVDKGQEAFALVAAPRDGEYQLAVGCYPDAEATDVSVKVDGIQADTLVFRRYANDRSSNQEYTSLHLKRGLHSIAIVAPSDRPLRVARLKVTQEPEEETPEKIVIHQRLLGRSPGEVPVAARKEAERVLAQFLTRAFRRPVQETDYKPFLNLYDRSELRGDPYEERIKLMLKAVLVAPEFLFRVEEQPAPNNLVAQSLPQALEDHELATRLSFFLWSSIPDEELRLVARNKTLSQDYVLIEQVDRMLESSRANEFFETFVGQWLGTRDVGGSVAPTFNAIQDVYTPDIATDMRREAILLFQTIVQEDLSLLQLIDSDFQYMTGRLAKFYGLDIRSGLRRNEFDRVELSAVGGNATQRGGVLGLGAVLAATSHVTSKETSPVLRGAWVLDTLLGTPVPAPPPDIPELPKRGKDEKKQSLREVLEAHRENATCAACHKLIDPIGFGLENFDFLGRWREKDGNKPLDVTGTLPSGETFIGPQELKKVLLNRKKEFLRQLTRKVLGYAIGRSLVDRDQCTIESIVEHLESNGFSARALIHQVVLSPQFRKKQLPAE